MKQLTWALLSVAGFLFACKKDSITEVATYENYGNLTPGNYWVYDRYYVHADGSLQIIPNQTDSNYVEKDTLINGNIYHKLMAASNELIPNTYVPQFLRDSLHYIVDWRGQIQFSAENFTDTFSSSLLILKLDLPDTIGHIFAQMADDGFLVTTPAGEFVTKNYRQTYAMWPKYQAHGADRYLHRRYAKDVGVVEETICFFIASPRSMVRILRSYGKQ